MSSVNGYGVQKVGQEESKIQREIETMELRESEANLEFAEEVNDKCDDNEDWCGLKRNLLDVASEVCGYTKGKPRHFKTRCWNKVGDLAVCRRRKLFRI